MEKTTSLSTSSIIKVYFFYPKPNGRYEFYFGSLAAIYEMFDADEIGCRLEALYSAHIDKKQKATCLCVISKHVLYRKSHKNR